MGNVKTIKGKNIVPQGKGKSKVNTLTVKRLRDIEAGDRLTRMNGNVKRFEDAYANYAKEGKNPHSGTADSLAWALYEYGFSNCAVPVLNYAIDPNRGNAGTLEKVSNSGCEKKLDRAKAGMRKAVDTVFDIVETMNMVKSIEDGGEDGENPHNGRCLKVVGKYNSKGDLHQTIDKSAWARVNALTENETLPDGMDGLQDTILEMLEQAEKHANEGKGWTQAERTGERLTRHVYSANIPMSELVGRLKMKEYAYTCEKRAKVACRNYVHSNRGLKVNPEAREALFSELVKWDGDGFTPVDPEDAYNQTVERIFRKGSRYDPDAYVTRMGVEIDGYSGEELQAVIDRLDLTARERKVLDFMLYGIETLEIAGYDCEGKPVVRKGWNSCPSDEEIAAYMGLADESSCRKIRHRIQDKVVNVHIATDELRKASREADPAKRIEQLRPIYGKDGKTVDGWEVCRVWESIGEAVRGTGFNKGNISGCINGKQQTVKGYKFRKA